MIPKLSLLNYLDMESCQEVGFAVAYWIMSSLPELRNINFEPANPVVEQKDWMRLYDIFLNVKFGHAFTQILPSRGNYVRLPEGYCEE